MFINKSGRIEVIEPSTRLHTCVVARLSGVKSFVMSPSQALASSHTFGLANLASMHRTLSPPPPSAPRGHVDMSLGSVGPGRVRCGMVGFASSLRPRQVNDIRTVRFRRF